MDNNKPQHSASICEKLINLIFNMVNRAKVPHASAEVSILEGSSRNGNGSDGYDVGSEIVVEFRHTTSGPGSILAPNKDGLISSSDRTTILQNGVVKREDGIDRKTSAQDLKKIVTIQESEDNNDQFRGEDTRAGASPRRRAPLLSVGSDINEKSDAYIQSRKKAMSRNYSFDPAQKS